jgi:transcriptional regulator with XRE-family HTH domain
MSTEATPAERPLSAHVAEEIRALMGRRDINKTELARRLGVSDMWVGRRLRGKLPIDLDDLQRIAVVLGVDVYDLLPHEPVRHTSRYLPGEHVLTTIGEPTDQTDEVRRPVKLRRPTGARPSVRPITPTAA